MAFTQQELLDKVEALIATYGVDLTIQKVLDPGVPDLYNQSNPVYGDAVTVRGHIAIDMSPGDIEKMGLTAESTGAVTFSAKTLREALPSITDDRQLVGKLDKLSLHSRSWRVTEVNVTGEVFGVPTVVFVGIADEPGVS